MIFFIPVPLIFMNPLIRKPWRQISQGLIFFISIHRNSYPTDNTVSGVESLIYDKSGIKYKMAQNINDQLESVGFVNLGVKERPGLVVLRRTQMPAVLVEVGFINSDVDNQIFDNNFNDIALAITQGFSIHWILEAKLITM